MSIYHPFSIFPLGDSALTIDFGNRIDDAVNKKVLRLFHKLKNDPQLRVLDLVPAYSSLTIYYELPMVLDPDKTAFDLMCEKIEVMTQVLDQPEDSKTNLLELPVCYSKRFALDLEALASYNKLSVQEVIRIHTSKTYRVYMLGFLPGFSYMGEVDERISMPRKSEPRLNVFAGAVGIAGKQTGIYPLESPGGWQIIGRTPVSLFRKDDAQPVLFQPGDEVKFYSISEDEFENYQAGNT
jgi:inhibitor of KinA